MGWMNDETGLGKCPANYVPLTPLSHLRRAAHVFATRTAVIYGDHRVTYAQYYERCTRLAAGLADMGVTSGDVVATLIPNLPAQAEAPFWRARMWRGIEHDQHAPRRRYRCLYF